MFEEIQLQNYTCFGNTTFDLRHKNGKAKKVAIIFGENGSGKSNIISSFYFLSRSLQTMSVRSTLNDVIDRNYAPCDDDLINALLKYRFNDMRSLIREFKMINSIEPMVLVFKFNLDGRLGQYIIETDDTRIIHEELEFTLVKNKSIYFDIKSDEIFIHTKIFNDSAYLHGIQTACQECWGNHSLLSIIYSDIRNKTDDFIASKYSKNFADVLAFFSSLSFKLRYYDYQDELEESLPNSTFINYEEGKIVAKKKNLLDDALVVLNYYFKAISKDIRKMWYEYDNKDGYLYYRLIQEKEIAGKIRTIPFSMESSGAKSLLHLLPFILNAASGNVSVVDEFDTAIHDMLLRSIVKSLCEGIEGQLIITMHSSSVMDSDIPKEYIYVIDQTKQGMHEIKCITQSKTQIRQKSSIHKQYMEGRYGGIPKNYQVNIKELLKLYNVKSPHRLH